MSPGHEAARRDGRPAFVLEDDNVFDPPVHTVGIELTSAAGKPAQGAIHVDDIRIEYPQPGEAVTADFERTLHSLRLWMAGVPDTTVVTGTGLGMLEPYGEAPA